MCQSLKICENAKHIITLSWEDDPDEKFHYFECEGYMHVCARKDFYFKRCPVWEWLNQKSGPSTPAARAREFYKAVYFDPWKSFKLLLVTI